MPELLIKSEQNLKAATLLINNGLYAPSVHSSYYSCFQKLKHVIASAYNCDYDDIDKELREFNRNRNKGHVASHEFLIDFKLSKFIQRENLDHRLINNLNELKRYRKQSDYENVSIREKESRSVLLLTNEVLNKLNNLL